MPMIGSIRHLLIRNWTAFSDFCTTVIFEGLIFLTDPFLARDLIYTSRTYATISVSVCLSVCPSVCDLSALWSRSMPGRGEGSSRAILATARPSCFFCFEFEISHVGTL